MDWNNQQTTIHTNDTRCSVPVNGDVHGTRFKQPYDYPKRDDNRKRNGNYKYILAIILSTLFPSQAFAETVGGVSATASPVANKQKLR